MSTFTTAATAGTACPEALFAACRVAQRTVVVVNLARVATPARSAKAILPLREIL